MSFMFKMFLFICRNWKFFFLPEQVAHRPSFLPSELTRGIFRKTDKLNFEAFKVFYYFLKHHGWIPGWILTCLDPKNLSVNFFFGKSISIYKHNHASSVPAAANFSFESVATTDTILRAQQQATQHQNK